MLAGLDWPFNQLVYEKPSALSVPCRIRTHLRNRTRDDKYTPRCAALSGQDYTTRRCDLTAAVPDMFSGECLLCPFETREPVLVANDIVRISFFHLGGLMFDPRVAPVTAPISPLR
jgi:hypothetical protein